MDFNLNELKGNVIAIRLCCVPGNDVQMIILLPNDERADNYRMPATKLNSSHDSYRGRLVNYKKLKDKRVYKEIKS
jgi:hypothetical protein